MPSNVIAQVHKLAADQPHLLTFADRDGIPIPDDPASPLKESSIPSHEIPGVIGDIVVTTPGVDMEDTKIADDMYMEDTKIADDTPIKTINTRAHSEATTETTTENDPVNTEPLKFDTTDATETQANPSSEEQAPQSVQATRQSTQIKKAPDSFILSMKGKKYDYSAMQIEQLTLDPRYVEFILTQLTLKAAVRL